MQLNQSGTLESRMRGNVHVRFGGGFRKRAATHLAGSLPNRSSCMSCSASVEYLYGDGSPTFPVQEAGPSPSSLRRPRPLRSRPRHCRPRRPGSPRDGDFGQAPPTAAATRTHPVWPNSPSAWTKDQEQRYEVGLLKYLNSWAKLQEFPGRMVDWDAEQVSQAYQEACRKLHAIQS